MNSLNLTLTSDSKRFGVAAFLKLGIPLSLTVGCFAITLFTDRTLLMWHNPVSSAASMSAGNVYWMFACVPVTAIGFATVIIAETMGRKSNRKMMFIRVWKVVGQCVWLTLFSLPYWLLLGVAAYPMFRWFEHPVELAEAETDYFRLLLTMAPASMLEAGLTAFLVGRRITTPVLMVNVSAAVVNVLLDFWLIFGGLGVPSLGVLGAAGATAIAMWIKVIVFALILIRTGSFRRHGRTAYPFESGIAAEIVGSGAALGIQQLVRMMAFSFILLSIGAGSVLHLAATTATLSVLQLLTIPLIGLATAVTVITSQARAVGGIVLAQKVGRRGLVLGMSLALLICILMAVFPKQMLSLTFAAYAPNEAVDVRTIAIELSIFAALYGGLDITATLLASLLKGFGRTVPILLSMVIATVVAMSVGLMLMPVDSSVTGSVAYYWWYTLLGWVSLQVAVLLASVWRIQSKRSSATLSVVSENPT